ncbi:type IV pili methyl-accepting chemotaxis transducer N-terminal domain-containing protein, partial [Flavobacteriaceae bacterium]|nr:type IV pili methyl-accepting chemotaxis transducer N-terminal domain-containing protein [Flavobacteriaceae bacterium]
MKKLYTLIVLFVAIMNQGYAQKMQLAGAINIAGKQRMLGQRMAKDKLYLEANKLTDKSEKELEKAIEAFELGIKILKDFAPTDLVKHKVNIQEYAFKQYKKTILDDSKESMDEIIKTNTLFLAICN